MRCQCLCSQLPCTKTIYATAKGNRQLPLIQACNCCLSAVHVCQNDCVGRLVPNDTRCGNYMLSPPQHPRCECSKLNSSVRTCTAIYLETSQARPMYLQGETILAIPEHYYAMGMQEFEPTNKAILWPICSWHCYKHTWHALADTIY